MSVDIQTVIETVAANEWTRITVNSSGLIERVLGLNAIPSFEEAKELTSKYPGCASRYLPRGKLNEDQVKEVIRGLVEALEYSRTHELRPGVNIPRKE